MNKKHEVRIVAEAHCNCGQVINIRGRSGARKFCWSCQNLITIIYHGGQKVEGRIVNLNNTLGPRVKTNFIRIMDEY